MSNKMCKRIRTNNFSQSERNLLVNIISTYRGIIENKKSDVLTLKAKDDAWEKVTDTFNSQSATMRSVKTLRSCWDNIKRKCRKSNADFKMEMFKTGGGQMEIVKDECDEKVRDILNFSLDGLHNPYDCDNEYNEGFVVDVELEESHEKPVQETVVIDNWSEWSSSLLKKPISKPLKIIQVADEKNPVEQISTPSCSSFTNTSNCINSDSPYSGKRKPSDFARRRPVIKKSAQELFWEEKKKYITLATEYLVTEENRKLAEEKRKCELHELELLEKKMKIHLLELKVKDLDSFPK